MPRRLFDVAHGTIELRGAVGQGMPVELVDIRHEQAERGRVTVVRIRRGANPDDDEEEEEEGGS